MNDDASRNEPGGSDLTGATDAELAELIAAGTWAHDADPPLLSSVTGLVATRRRRRRYTLAAGGAGLACAAAAALIFAFQPHQADSTGPAPATQSPTSTQVSTAVSPAACTMRNQLISDHGTTTYHGRRADTVYLENIGSSACIVTDFPKVELGTPDYRFTVDSTRAVGPWVLRHNEALTVTVVAPPTRSCLISRGFSHEITLTTGGWAYTVEVPRMHGGDCEKAPTLAPVHVVKVRD